MRRAIVVALVGICAVAAPAMEALAQTVQYHSPAGVEYRSQVDTGAIARAESLLALEPRNIDRIIQLGVAQSGGATVPRGDPDFHARLGDRAEQRAAVPLARTPVSLGARLRSRDGGPQARRSTRQHDLRHLVPHGHRPLRARRLQGRSQRILARAVYGSGGWRAGRLYGLALDVAHACRQENRGEEDARPAPRLARGDERVCAAAQVVSWRDRA